MDVSRLRIGSFHSIRKQVNASPPQTVVLSTSTALLSLNPSGRGWMHVIGAIETFIDEHKLRKA